MKNFLLSAQMNRKNCLLMHNAQCQTALHRTLSLGQGVTKNGQGQKVKMDKESLKFLKFGYVSVKTFPHLT